jgi:uncharacterized repeat protein (TIGR03803 family)
MSLRGLPILLLMVVASQATSAQTFTVLYSFSGGADGAFPYSGLIRDTVGNLYGTTSAGGASNLGTVFRIGGNSETVLYTFKGGKDGALPYSGLVRDTAGNLYGTTAAGGSSNCALGCGTVFKLDHRGNETVLYTFSGGSDGANPYADLLRDPAGNLYGTAQYGGEFNCSVGSSGCGVVFKLDKHGHGDETVSTLLAEVMGQFPTRVSSGMRGGPCTALPRWGALTSALPDLGAEPYSNSKKTVI